MTTFIQMHLLTSYPPANLNRDDLGRPKTASMGGAQRLRVSSQSLKRAWRTSDLFQTALAGHVGIRTRRLGTDVYHELCDGGISPQDAKNWAEQIAEQFGKLKSSKGNSKESGEGKTSETKTDEPAKDKKAKKHEADVAEIEQLVHLSPEERQAVKQLVQTLIRERRAPQDAELKLLRTQIQAADIALFGRMLASSPAHSIEAAAQVAHAITVHKAAIEDDYFTAVDDLNLAEDNSGAAHVGVAGFGAGLFYLYVCINRDLLLENLQQDPDLTARCLRSITELAATVAPGGKQNSFASRANASYILAEKGSRQPRSLAVAFLKPIQGQDLLTDSIHAINHTRHNFDQVYGSLAEASYVLDVQHGQGQLQQLLDFVATPISQGSA